ncbi:MAG: hypothetical protein ACFFER_18855 [Candidatus Thorarchaeota archaeon]
MAMFAKDKKTGELAVKKAYALLKTAGYEPELPLEPQKDHDIVLGDGRKVEVKFDVVMDTTGNLGVEWWSDVEARKEGWGQYCEADILMQFYNMDNAVVVDWHKFRVWLLDRFQDFERKDSKYSNADVILVPKDEIPDSVKLQDIGQMFSLDYGLEEWELDAIRGKRSKIEPAKSGRAECTYCGYFIRKGELRIQEEGKWLHLKCAALKKVISAKSLERLIGIEDLTDWQVDHIKEILKHKEI